MGNLGPAAVWSLLPQSRASSSSKSVLEVLSRDVDALCIKQVLVFCVPESSVAFFLWWQLSSAEDFFDVSLALAHESLMTSEAGSACCRMLGRAALAGLPSALSPPTPHLSLLGSSCI